jgi:cytochrome c
MKKIVVTVFAMAALIACNNSDTTSKPAETKETAEVKPAATDLSANPDYEAGLALVGNNGCFQCHKVDEPLTGPTYRQVADKYAAEGAAAIPKLAKKIIEGGSGVWGQIPMIAHPSVTQEDAEKMVKYILLLKK